MRTKIPKILDDFEIKYSKSGHLLIAKCPIHHGDNLCAFNVNVDQSSRYCGRWFCNTKGCHKEYGGDEIGLLRGLMTSKNNEVQFADVVKYAESICDNKSVSILADHLTEILNRGKQKTTSLTREQIRARLEIPPEFYLSRGFSREVLDEFDVGLCTNPKTEMYNRVVFPIYDNSGKYMAGCVGRTICNDKVKWKNQKGFNKGDFIYGYAKTLPYVCRTGVAILVEGQGDVMKLWMAGIKNVFGMLGSQLNSNQELLLQRTGVTDIITFGDKDEAGNKFRSECDRKLTRLFNVKHIIPELHDAGEMSIEDLRKTFGEFV